MLKQIITKIRCMKMNNSEFNNYLRKKGCVIGEGCDIAKNVIFADEPWLVHIGNNVRITQNVQFITHDGGLWTLRKMGLLSEKDVKYGKIIVGNNVNISWNVMILPGVTIGDNCVIAAGAIVTKDIPAGEVWGGIPAKKIETIDEYFEKVKDKVVPTFGMSNEKKHKYLLENCPELFN